MRARPWTTRYSRSPIGFVFVPSSDRLTRGSRWMLRSLRWSGRCPHTISSPSRPTQTIDTCGLPSGLIVTRCASASDSSSSRACGCTPARVTSVCVMREVGRVAALWRYPVKSMAGQALDEVEVSWQGFAGDRRWAFIQDGLVRSHFPWLTIRERPDMWHYEPFFTDPDQPNKSPTFVRTPSGRELDVVDPALAEELGDGVRLIKQNRGVFDQAPLSLISTQTVAGIGALAGAELTPLRFRPNLVVDASGDFPEEDWVGSVLRIGGFSMRVDQKDERCVMINIDPVSTERNNAVLKAAGRERDACLGVYGTTVQPGRVAIGDPVALED